MALFALVLGVEMEIGNYAQPVTCLMQEGYPLENDDGPLDRRLGFWLEMNHSAKVLSPVQED